MRGQVKEEWGKKMSQTLFKRRGREKRWTKEKWEIYAGRWRQ